ncbi:MAG: biopolymer transporter ExbD [Gammaproteobacteria bacterium]|nr:biopolymer transporter ExbD [Gammaproteobacteria bacterium]
MAMNIGPNGSGGDPEVMIDINITPLIDVLLVLLVMLIITIPIQMHAVNLNLPVGNPPPPVQQPEVVDIYIDFDGTISWNGVVVPNHRTLVDDFELAAQKPDQPEVHVRPNNLASYKYVAEVLAAAQSSGLTKLGVVGNAELMN